MSNKDKLLAGVDLRSIQPRYFTTLCQLVGGTETKPPRDVKSVLMCAVHMECEQHSAFMRAVKNLTFPVDSYKARRVFDFKMHAALEHLVELAEVIKRLDETQANVLFGYIKEVVNNTDDLEIATRCAAVYEKMQAASNI
jgi:hypothetical protein